MRACLGLAVVLLLAAPAPADAWSYEVHRFITDRAIALLPPEIRAFFAANRATLVERSIDPDTWRVVGFEEEDAHHFLQIDAREFGAYPFLALPREYDAAVQKFGLTRIQSNGTLPWRIEEFHGNLRRAFERVRQAANGRFDIVLMSAVLGHYASDATQPFHTVTNFDGQLTRQKGVHSRFERELFARFRARVSVAPTSMAPVRMPRDFAFETILESSQLAGQVLKADAAAAGTRGQYDDAYYEAFYTRARPVLERGINTAIAAVAAMITGAWEAAGKPRV